MEASAETKRDRVRRILIDPLLQAGMKKQTRMKQPEYEAFQIKLCDRLSHMSDKNLLGMVSFITRHAKGGERNQWPDEVSIVSCALSIQPPPPRSCPYVVSVLKSEAGQRAKTLGYHVELFMFVRKFGPPFSKVNRKKLADEAQENRKEMSRVVNAIERGTALEERRQWLDWYLRHEAEALAIIDQVEEVAA